MIKETKELHLVGSVTELVELAHLIHKAIEIKGKLGVEIDGKKVVVEVEA